MAAVQRSTLIDSDPCTWPVCPLTAYDFISLLTCCQYFCRTCVPVRLISERSRLRCGHGHGIGTPGKNHHTEACLFLLNDADAGPGVRKTAYAIENKEEDVEMFILIVVMFILLVIVGLFF